MSRRSDERREQPVQQIEIPTLGAPPQTPREKMIEAMKANNAAMSKAWHDAIRKGNKP